MCGRYTLSTPTDILAAFGLKVIPHDLRPRFNIAPGQRVWAVLNVHADAGRVRQLRWGLCPRWAKDPRVAYKMINARCESLDEKPAFREAFASRRCLIPASGFYEWRRAGARKTPYYIRRKDRGAMALAGLWEQWRAPAGSVLETCTIVTAPANPLVAPIHDRMPVVVDQQDHERWLQPEPITRDGVADILRSPGGADLELFEVSSLVNSVKNDQPSLIEPHCPQPSLF